eukprot:gnl/TRDRNA2_/TRDRNA2_31351_c0_seq1.p1 gnl/TRDRNA2_/TRDRNA2_31351_c0~~gnl/TRDRNA2_/TRDRNA2_31351_c0_seq1.p1  ORF type:complete len:1012 (+),score=115.36 gnl/TRDRNA2_/TRDRNA2_31351_c0_seq1:51-3086(+)
MYRDGADEALLPRPTTPGCRSRSATAPERCKQCGCGSLQRLINSLVAGGVSFLLCTILGITFGVVVFRAVPGGVPIGIQLTLVGVNVVGNAVLVFIAKLPCVVVTADNGVVAPIVAQVIADLAKRIEDPDALQATASACVSVACTVFGLVQLMLVKLRIVRMVQYMPYSVPMGFLSGIGLELCSGISLAGTPLAQAAAALFAATLCIGSWWRGWPLSVLFPLLLTISMAAFYIFNGPTSWLLEVEGGTPSRSLELLYGLWMPGTRDLVRWDLLAEVGCLPLLTLCALGCLQNCFFADLYSRAPGLKDPVDRNEVLYEFSQSFSAGGLLGFVGGFHNMACFSLSRELHSYRRVPGAVTAILSLVLVLTGLGPLLRIPRFVFAALLLWVGLKFLRTYLVQPARMLPRKETAMIVAVTVTMKVGGFSLGIAVGLGLAMVTVIGELASLSCVQHVSTGSETRSNAVRSARAEHLLLQHGHENVVIRLAPGFIFFATCAQILEIVEQKLHLGTKTGWLTLAAMEHATDSLKSPLTWTREISPQPPESSSDSDLDSSPPTSKLQNVVIDFMLCRGFDGSTVVLLSQLASLGEFYGFQLRLAGLHAAQQDWLTSQAAKGVCSFFPDLDRALEEVEDSLLAKRGLTVSKELRRRPSVSAGLAKRLTRCDTPDTPLDSLAPIAEGWVLLLLDSATSWATRTMVANIMAQVDCRCKFFDTPEQQCPILAQLCKVPVPALVLLNKGQLVCNLGDAHIAPGGANVGADLGLLNPEEIVREIEKHMDAADLSVSAHEPTSASEDLLNRLQHAVSLQESKSATRLPRARSRRFSTTATAWPRFLELAGVPSDSPLTRICSHLRGPTTILPDTVVQTKGATTDRVIFVLSGMLSLWNEGPSPGCNEILRSPRSEWTRQRQSENKRLHRELLSVGTSRLMRIGPGWVLGAIRSAGSSVLRQPVVPFSVVAETDVILLELPTAAVQEVQRSDPDALLTLHELLAHFSAVLLQHAARQLADWNAITFAS